VGGANGTLGQRVAERTREADAANLSRTRFLAAISHDVLQPMNAARLFASALHGSDSPSEQRHLAERVDTALRAAEELLDGLLDISRLDAGALKPARSLFALDDLLREVAEQFLPLASSRGVPGGRARLTSTGSAPAENGALCAPWRTAGFRFPVAGHPSDRRRGHPAGATARWFCRAGHRLSGDRAFAAPVQRARTHRAIQRTGDARGIHVLLVHSAR